MSIENHPNLHAIKFVTRIIQGFEESLRGKAFGQRFDIYTYVVDFVEEIELLVDSTVEENKEGED